MQEISPSQPTRPGDRPRIAALTEIVAAATAVIAALIVCSCIILVRSRLRSGDKAIETSTLPATSARPPMLQTLSQVVRGPQTESVDSHNVSNSRHTPWQPQSTPSRSVKAATHVHAANHRRRRFQLPWRWRRHAVAKLGSDDVQSDNPGSLYAAVAARPGAHESSGSGISTVRANTAVRQVDTHPAGSQSDSGHITVSVGMALSMYDTAVAAREATFVQQKARLTSELDYMRQHDERFLGYYAVLPWTERREGGQGVVQFMRNTRSEVFVAVKFFLSRSAYDTEMQLYKVDVLRSMMPAIRMELKNSDNQERNSRGYPWPPCLVLEKGESLQEWKARTQPALSTILDVRLVPHHFWRILVHILL